MYKRQTLPLPDTSKLEKLNRELEKSEKKLRKAINDEKALQHQLKQHTATGTEPVRPFLSGKLFQLVLPCLFIIDGFPQFLLDVYKRQLQS